MVGAEERVFVGDLDHWRAQVARFEAEVGRAVIGQDRVIRALTIAILSRGHVLLEGDVGVGKTTLLRALARALGGPYERVEGTIDLMPADLVYHASIGEAGRPRIDPGPMLRHGSDLAIFFFNEINRARPQVHALLLRLMAERSVTAFNREMAMPHLLVFADRNRLERETFELPAAARDRFFMEVSVEAPSDPETCRKLIFDTRYHDTDALVESVAPAVLDYRALTELGARLQREIRASPTLEMYLVAIWQALRNPAAAGIAIAGVQMDRLVQGGVSPRGLSYLARAARVQAWLSGRMMVVPEDVRAVFPEVMEHRIFLDPIYANSRGVAGARTRPAGIRARARAVTPNDAEAWDAAVYLDYRVHWREGGARPGRHSTHQAGSDGAFRGYRPFWQSPDARRIDVRRSALDPSGDVMVRETGQRSSLNLVVAADVSLSLRPDPSRSALDGIVALAEAALRSTSRAGDGFGLLAFDRAVRDDVYPLRPTRSGVAAREAVSRLARAETGRNRRSRYRLAGGTFAGAPLPRASGIRLPDAARAGGARAGRAGAS